MHKPTEQLILKQGQLNMRLWSNNDIGKKTSSMTHHSRCLKNGEENLTYIQFLFSVQHGETKQHVDNCFRSKRPLQKTDDCYTQHIYDIMLSLYKMANIIFKG